MRFLGIILIIILFSFCQINDKDSEKALERISRYAADDIEFMMHNIFAKDIRS